MSERVAELPPLREVIAQHQLLADKSLGQHFLLDLNITRRIVRAAGSLAGKHVLEIGPGPGGLTRALLESDAASITAIEFDPRCIAALDPLVELAGTRLRLLQADALHVDFLSLVSAPRVVIANVPYNVGTPLLTGWMAHAQLYESFTLMLQAEVVERIVSGPDCKTYGRLAVLCQYACEARRAFTVPARAFTPPPKIDSAIVHLVPRATFDPALVPALERITAAAFGQRRKMLRQSLKGVDGNALLERTGIDPTLRAENLSVADFVALAKLARA